jgi:hypothetical protein
VAATGFGVGASLNASTTTTAAEAVVATKMQPTAKASADLSIVFMIAFPFSIAR